MDRCKEQVVGEGKFGSFHPHQCRKLIWKDGYCKVHHPESVAIRREKINKRWEEKRKNDPVVKLIRAHERIEELEKEVEELKVELKRTK